MFGIRAFDVLHVCCVQLGAAYFFCWHNKYMLFEPSKQETIYDNEAIKNNQTDHCSAVRSMLR